MDESFLFALREEMVKYRDDLNNDLQLKMAVGFLNQKINH